MNSYKQNNSFQYLKLAGQHLEEFFLKSSTLQKELEEARVQAFKIQAFSRVLRKAFKKESPERLLIDELKTLSKSIEDQIGNYLYYFEMHVFAQKEADEKNISSSKKQLENSKDILLKKRNALLEKSHRTTSIISSILSDFDLKKYYLKGLLKELKSLEEKMKLIDPKLLEDGTHELRRLIRWVIMYFVYPENLFIYDENNINHDKYTQLSNSKTSSNDLVEIHYKSIKTLSQWVGELGSMKDAGLYENFIKPKKDHNVSQPEIIKLTKTILKDSKKLKPFKKLRKALRA